MSHPLTGIRAVIVDLDGTLLDTAPDFHVAINRMRQEMKTAAPPISLDTVITYIGKGSENLVRRVLSLDFSQDEAEQRFDTALEAYFRHYGTVNGEFATLYPQVHEGLQGMQFQGLRLACVTNKPRAFALALLERAGLNEYFEIVYGGDSFALKKPFPDPFLQVFRDFSLTPQQVLAIGDSANDAQAARAAGCPIVIVPYGYNHGEDVQKIDSDGIVPTLLAAAQRIAA